MIIGDERIAFAEARGIVEVDLSGMVFEREEQVDELYDELDKRLATTKRRWYFLVNYSGCAVSDRAWDRWAARGRHTNLTHGLGTARYGAAPALHEAIRAAARREHFRANLFEGREDAVAALEALGRRRSVGSPDASGPILAVEDVHLSFGGVRALQGVGFAVQAAEIFSIIGPNGAGKTSMLNVISGVYHPSKGRLLFQGRDRTRLGPQAVARLGIARTFQNVALFKGMTVLENILIGRHTHMGSGVFASGFWWGPGQREEIQHRAAVERVIDFLEINHIRKTPTGALPYGLQKRVELGRALAMDPKLLLLDEPMAGMNLEEKEDMARFILDVNDEWGTTTILIEHDMGVVMDISSHVVVLDHGEKIAEGTPDEVRADSVVIRAYLGEEQG